MKILILLFIIAMGMFIRVMIFFVDEFMKLMEEEKQFHETFDSKPNTDGQQQRTTK